MGKCGRKSNGYVKTKKPLCNQRVGGSNPSVGSRKMKGGALVLIFFLLPF